MRWKPIAMWTTALAGAAAGGYMALVARAWALYGHPRPGTIADEDPLLDRFMPAYDVAERHAIHVNAPAALALAAAREADLLRSPLVRAIFRARELVLGATPDDTPRPRGLLAETQALGWRVLAETPDHEVIVGAVTQPWLPNVTFRGLEPDAFRTFAEPGFVKIAWTLRADATSDRTSIFRTETRVAATDDSSRRKFRRYWARFSPGIVLIRLALLRPLKVEAERRARAVS
jgi:hypothetical protein